MAIIFSILMSLGIISNNQTPANHGLHSDHIKNYQTYDDSAKGTWEFDPIGG